MIAKDLLNAKAPMTAWGILLTVHDQMVLGNLVDVQGLVTG